MEDSQIWWWKHSFEHFSVSKFKQLDWPKLVLTMKFFQFKMCHLAMTDNILNWTKASKPMSCKQCWLVGNWEHHFTNWHQVCPRLRQLSWPKFMLPIKFFQFKMCQLAVIDAFHYQCTCDVNKPGFHVEHLSSTNSHRASVFILDLLLCWNSQKLLKIKKCLW